MRYPLWRTTLLPVSTVRTTRTIEGPHALVPQRGTHQAY